MTPITNLDLSTPNDKQGTILRDWGQIINNNFAIVQSDTVQVQTNLTAHESDTTNPHSVTKAQVGLPEADNTSDANKPVSTATQNALDDKQDTSEKGQANWYAGLDGTGKVPSSQLPDSAGLWDMTKTTYDPQGIEADAFSMDNMVEGVDTKILTEAERTKLASVEVNADVTDSVNVDSAGAVMESDYSQAKSILAQQSGTWSPEVVQVGSNELVGRTSGGASNIDSLSASEVRTILNIEDGATADQTASEIKTAYESNADTNVFTDAEKTNLGNQSGTNTWDQDLSGYAQLANTNTFTEDQVFTWDIVSTGNIMRNNSWNMNVHAEDSYRVYIDTNNNDTGRFFSINKDDLSTGGSAVELFRVREDGNVWIGTPSPWSKLEVKWGDIEVDDIGDWVIIKSPDGTRWRITIDNSGNLTTTSL